MKTNKPIIMLIPSSIISGLESFLKTIPDGKDFKTIYFYYIVHYLTSMHLKKKDQEYIKINLKYLKCITVSNIASYITILKKGEFIITEPYIPGIKSTGYKLNVDNLKNLIKPYLNEFTKVKVDPETKIFERIRKSQSKARAHNNRLEPYLKAMYDMFMNTELDYQSAEKWIYNQPDAEKRYFYSTSLMQLQDKRFRHFNRNKTNKRLDTNFTNLKKELRQFIIGDYVSIDLKNSQPFFLSQVIKAIINNNRKDKPNTILSCCYLCGVLLSQSFGVRAFQRVSLIHQKDKKANLVNLKQFTDSTINGNVYDDFLKLYNGDLTRDEVKRIIIKVLFSRNEITLKYRKFIPYESDKKKFASVFPFINEVVKTLKTKDHASLAIYLQRLESYIFIDCIAKELFNNGIVPLTIHDSVMIKTGDQEKALTIINDIFKQNFGVVPSFHVEPFTRIETIINHKFKLI